MSSRLPFRSRLRWASSTLAALTLPLGLAACQTIDVGPTTGPPQGCVAPAPFFVTDVWPKYFNNYSCGKSGCHDASTGHGYFRLESVAGVPTPNPTDPVTIWPEPWSFNLDNAQANVSCDNPTTSVVLIVPSGQSEPHPGGIVVTDIPGADALFTMWLTP